MPSSLDPDLRAPRAARCGPAPRPRRARGLARMGPLRPLPGDGQPGFRARPRPRRGRVQGLRRDLPRQARRARPKRGRRACARRRRPALRGDRGSARPDHLLCRPRLFRRHHRSEARQVLRRHAGAPDLGLDASSCSSRSSSTASTMRCSTPRCRRSRSPTTGPGSRTSARTSRYQLEDKIEQLFHEKSVTGRGGLEPPVRRDHRLAPLRGRRRGADARADAQHAAGRRRNAPPRRRRGARQDVQGEPAHLHADHQHARRRTRRSPTAGAASRTSPIRATSPTASSPRSSMRWSPRCAKPIRACRTATTR